MRVVIQRVSSASVAVDGEVIGAIEKGFLILLGIETEDTEGDVTWLAKKIISLRIFSDEQGLMNQDIINVDGSILLISQFTLHAAYKKGNRPSFIKAARPEQAIPLYQFMKSQLETFLDKHIATGQFGADMKVSLVNDGPVTIIMDSKTKE